MFTIEQAKDAVLAIIKDTNQEHFKFKIFTFLESVHANNMFVKSVNANPETLSPFHVHIEIGAEGSEKTLVCGTSFAEFYLSRNGEGCLFSQSAWGCDVPAYDNLMAFMVDYLNDHTYTRCIESHGVGKFTQHDNLVQALDSHLTFLHFGALSMHPMVICSGDLKITFKYEPELPYWPDRVTLTVENANPSQLVLINAIAHYVNGRGQNKLVQVHADQKVAA